MERVRFTSRGESNKLRMENKQPRFEIVHIPIGDFTSDGETYSEFSAASSKTDNKGSSSSVLPSIALTTTKKTPAKSSTKSVHFTPNARTPASSATDKTLNSYLQLPALAATKESYPPIRAAENDVRRAKGAVKEQEPQRLEGMLSNDMALKSGQGSFKVSVLLQEHVQALKKALIMLSKEAKNTILGARMKEGDDKFSGESTLTKGRKKVPKSIRRNLKAEKSVGERNSSRSGEENLANVAKENGELMNKSRKLGSQVVTGLQETAVGKNTSADESSSSDFNTKRNDISWNTKSEGTGEEDCVHDQQHSQENNNNNNNNNTIYPKTETKHNTRNLKLSKLNRQVSDASSIETRNGKKEDKARKAKKELSLMERYRVPRDARSLVEELYKLGQVADADNLKELADSKDTAEKELRKAIKKEKILEKEEQKKKEKEQYDKKRRESHYIKMEELAKEEAEKREAVLRLKEKKKILTLKRQKRNMLLWNEIQTSILATRTTRAFQFSYYPPLPYISRITVPETPTQSPEPSISMASEYSSALDSPQSSEGLFDFMTLDDFEQEFQ